MKFVIYLRNFFQPINNFDCKIYLISENLLLQKCIIKILLLKTIAKVQIITIHCRKIHNNKRT